jgi:hypothetical protein
MRSYAGHYILVFVQLMVKCLIGGFRHIPHGVTMTKPETLYNQSLWAQSMNPLFPINTMPLGRDRRYLRHSESV